MYSHPFVRAIALLALTCLTGACRLSQASLQEGQVAQPTPITEEEPGMLIHYLEIVTPDVEATCEALGGLHGVEFGEPEEALGNARTAVLEGGGMVGVRAPMRETEEPVVRPYMLVDDIEAAVTAAEAAGAEIAMPPTELPGHGQFAIYILGGIDHGLWQR